MLQLPVDMELINGVGDPAIFHIRRATPEDVGRVVALQQAIVDALPDKDIYATSTREEYLLSLREDCCFLAEHEGDVAGFSVLIPNTLSPRNYGHYLNYSDEQLLRTASFDLTMVAPRYRGYGLQRAFNKFRIGIAKDLGATEGLTSISPDNPYSYRNFLVLNFNIIEQRKMYGGKERYILRREL